MKYDQHDLLTKARNLDESALGVIYDQYSPGLYRYACRLLGDQCLAEDCVSETFSRFLQALGKGNGPVSHLQAYLYRIAHNWITDHYRNNHIEKSLEGNIEMKPIEGCGEIDAIEKLKVRSALFQLTAEQRQVIVLKFLEGWDNESVAGLINKPVNAVKALQHRALVKLRKVLLDSEEKSQ